MSNNFEEREKSVNELSISIKELGEANLELRKALNTLHEAIEISYGIKINKNGENE